MMSVFSFLPLRTCHQPTDQGGWFADPSVLRWVANLGVAVFAMTLGVPAGLAPSMIALLFAGVIGVQLSSVERAQGFGPVSVITFVLIYLAGLFQLAPGSDLWVLSAPMVLGLAVYLLMLRIADDSGSKLIGWGLWVSVAMQAFAVLTMSLDGHLPMDVITRIKLPILIVPNDLAVAVIMLSLGRALLPGRQFSGVMWGLGVLLAAAAVVLETRTTLLVLAVVLGIGENKSGIVLSRRLMHWLILGVAVMAMLWLTDFRLIAKTLGGLQARAELWSLAIDRIAERPWLGWGPYALEFSGLASDPRRMAWPHNLLLETWASLGAVGLLAWMASVVVHCRHLLIKVQGPRRQRLIAAGAGMAGFALLEASWMRIGFVVCWMMWLALIASSPKNTDC